MYKQNLFTQQTDWANKSAQPDTSKDSRRLPVLIAVIVIVSTVAINRAKASTTAVVMPISQDSLVDQWGNE